MARTLWMSNGGEVICSEHAGSYLTGAITSRPRARKHTTPLGVWERITPADLEGWAQQYPDSPPVACETCRPYAPVAPSIPATVKADDGTELTVPPAPVLAAYAVAMYGEGHGPLDDGTPEAHDALVSIAGQAAFDATSGNDPYGVFGGGPEEDDGPDEDREYRGPGCDAGCGC